MRILGSLLLTALITTGATAADKPAAKKVVVLPSAKSGCQNGKLQNVDQSVPRAGVHPLNREPNAKQILTVIRTVDGCMKPVLVREDVGSAPKVPAKAPRS